MRKLAVILLFVSVIALLRGEAWAQYRRPNVSYEAAGNLAQMARAAMNEYLHKRITPEKFTVPENLTIFDSERYEYTVFLTLRLDGMKLSSASASGMGLARNTVAAALKAMRGSALGDEVTEQSLAKLMVEIEIMGTPEVVPEQEVAAKLIPGLLGLRFWSGIDDPKLVGLLKMNNIDVTILPSEEYRNGWTVAEIKEKILETVSRNDNSTLPDANPKWQIFSTLHYVNPADTKQCYIYYRGKILRVYPGDKYFLVTLLNALARNFSLEKGVVNNPDGTTGPLWQQLYLVHVLRKVAAANSGDVKKLSASIVNEILGKVAKKRVRFDRKLDVAYVMADEVDDEVLTTAFLSLAIAGDNSDAEIVALHKAIRNYLFKRIDKDGVMTDSRERSVSNLAFAVALRAIAQEKMTQDQMTIFCKAMDTLLARTGEMGNSIKKSDSLSLTETAWLARTIIAGGPNVQTQYLTFLKRFTKKLIDAQPEFTQLLDENGALMDSHGRADTVATATAACVFSEMQTVAKWPGAASASRKALDFCWMMSYRPNEAYFAPNPVNWPGTVRVTPADSKISLAAGAAVLDAVSTMQPQTPAAK